MSRWLKPSRIVGSLVVILTTAVLSSCAREASDPTSPTISTVTVHAKGGGNGGGGGGDAPTVTAADPSSLPKGIVNVNLEITGSGFTSSSEVSFEIDGVETGEIVTNGVSFVDETQLIANVDVTEEALETLYDIAVRNGPKKKGVGIDLLKVTAPLPADPAIVFKITGTTDQIRVVDATGANETTIWETEWMFSPAISPDGSKIVFRDVVADGLYTLDLSVDEAGKPFADNLTLVWSDGAGVAPEWSPDGTEIVSSGGSPNAIWVTAADGSGIEMIYPAPADRRVAWPTWNPSGDQIAFIERDFISEEGIYEGNPALVVIDRSDGSVAEWQALGDLAKPAFPSWQRTPGGSLVALHATPPAKKRKDRKPHIYIVDVLGDAPPQQIAEGSGPTWSPDDSELAFIEGQTGKLVAYDRATGAVRTIVSNGGAPDWRR